MSGDAVRLLLIEDEPAHAIIVQRHLASATDPRFEIVWVDHLAAALERLADREFDAVLLDLSLPDSDPRTTLQRVLAATAAPVVVLTSSENREQAVAAVKAGAQDQLPKQRISTDLLVRSVAYAIERKATERQLKQFNENLERRVAERSAIAEARARMLRRLAVELSQAESRERRRLAHLLHDELQQLIVASRMRLEMLAGGIQDEQQRELMNQAIDLLNQSVDASRSLAVDLSPPVLQERGLGGALEWLARRMATQHALNVHLTVHGDAQSISDSMSSFLFDAAKELLFNVVKHAGVDCAEAVLDCTDPQQVTVIVTDAGKGIDSVQYGKDEKSPDRFGLFSIRERVAAIDGSVEVESGPGRGTTVRLQTPYELDDGDGEPVVSPSIPRTLLADANGATRNRGNKKPTGLISILIVDDHRIVRQGLISAIGSQPDLHVVAEASDGFEAIDAVESHPVDVIVMDISMPRLNGVEATRRIKQRWPHIRIIGLSMHEPADFETEMQSAGATCFLNKSGPIEALFDAIRSVPAEPIN